MNRLNVSRVSAVCICWLKETLLVSAVSRTAAGCVCVSVILLVKHFWPEVNIPVKVWTGTLSDSYQTLQLLSSFKVTQWARRMGVASVNTPECVCNRNQLPAWECRELSVSECGCRCLHRVLHSVGVIRWRFGLPRQKSFKVGGFPCDVLSLRKRAWGMNGHMSVLTNNQTVESPFIMTENNASHMFHVL